MLDTSAAGGLGVRGGGLRVLSDVATIIGVTAYLLVLAATGGLPDELFELLPRRRR